MLLSVIQFYRLSNWQGLTSSARSRAMLAAIGLAEGIARAERDRRKVPGWSFLEDRTRWRRCSGSNGIWAQQTLSLEIQMLVKQIIIFRIGITYILCTTNDTLRIQLFPDRRALPQRASTPARQPQEDHRWCTSHSIWSHRSSFHICKTHTTQLNNQSSNEGAIANKHIMCN